MARGVFRCRACDGETSLTAGTVFQDTRKPLRTWSLAMWFMSRQKNSVASLLKRWLLGTLQGGVQQQHLDYYLDEFTFRFNRRRSSARRLLFHRLA